MNRLLDKLEWVNSSDLGNCPTCRVSPPLPELLVLALVLGFQQLPSSPFSGPPCASDNTMKTTTAFPTLLRRFRLPVCVNYTKHPPPTASKSLLSYWETPLRHLLPPGPLLQPGFPSLLLVIIEEYTDAGN